MKTVTVADLKKHTGACLHCQLCGADFSANAGDYGNWNGFPQTHVFEHCGRPMRLAFKKTIYVDFNPQGI